MTRSEMQNRVAENINQLDVDGSTIRDGRVTATGINNRLDYAWREILFPRLSQKYPDDFAQLLYPESMYTATSTVSASSSGVELYSNTAIFDNTMEGVYVQNPARESSIKIATYVTSTHVTLESTIATDSWTTGDTIYVLGNEYGLGGTAANLKEVSYVATKYNGQDFFRPAKRGNKRDLLETGTETYSQGAPVWYLTSIDVAGVTTPAIGILPPPTSYLDKFEIEGPQKPIALTSSGSPMLSNAGISHLIINEVTSWALKLKGDKEGAVEYEELHPRYGVVPKGFSAFLLSYHPKTASGNSKFKTPKIYKVMKSRKA